MAGFSKYILFTDDQTELSGTRETIDKDRKRAKLRLRWDRVLNDELGKVKAEEFVFDKNYGFEKHRYEMKLKRIRDEKRTQWNRTGADMKNGSFSDIPRDNEKKSGQKTWTSSNPNRNWWRTHRNLKWSINESSDLKLNKLYTASIGEARGSNYRTRVLPRITTNNAFHTRHRIKGTKNDSNDVMKRPESGQESFEYKTKSFPYIICPNH